MFRERIIPFMLDMHGRIIPQHRTDRQFNNTFIRLQYMNNDITKDKYKSTLQSREKEREFNYEVRAILDTFMAVMIEYVTVYNNSVRDYTNDKRDEILVIQLEQLKLISEFSDFINNQLEEISYYYSMTVPIIDKDRWFIVTKKVTRKDALASVKAAAETIQETVKKPKKPRTKKAVKDTKDAVSVSTKSTTSSTKKKSIVAQIFELDSSDSDIDLNSSDEDDNTDKKDR